MQTLEGHVHNVTSVCFHPELPLIVSGSEDGTIRLWHTTTYRLKNTLNYGFEYGFERAWCLAFRKGSNDIAVGFDEGSIVLRLCREETAISMDNSGKIIWAKHNEVQPAIVGKPDEVAKDGEALIMFVKVRWFIYVHTYI